MSEQIADELAVLRRTNAELLKKSSDRGIRIKELVATNTDLQAQVVTLQGSLQEITVGGPLRQLASEISPVPELWMSEFSRHFKLESKGGILTVLTIAGEPAMNREGKPLEFTRSALIAHLTKSGDAAFKTFPHIMASTFASGGGAGAAQSGGGIRSAPSEAAPASPAPQVHFGLR